MFTLYTTKFTQSSVLASFQCHFSFCIVSHLDTLVPQFNKVAREFLIDNLRERADGKTVVDMWNEFGKTTLQVISVVCVCANDNGSMMELGGSL